MYSRFFKAFFSKLNLSPRKLLASTALAYTLFARPFHLRDQSATMSPNEQYELLQNMKKQQQSQNSYIEAKLKQLTKITICNSRDLLEGQMKVVEVEDDKGRTRYLMVTRYKGKAYAFVGQCPYDPPFQTFEKKPSLQGAAIFNDKLYCPHHGCAFDIQTGSVENGPAFTNLPRLAVQQIDLTVKILYPTVLPSAVVPQQNDRDPQDFRKVLIAGGDDQAVIGCIHSLRQFGYPGQIHVLMDQKRQLPYRKEYLHKSIRNFRILDRYRQIKEKKAQPEKKQEKKSFWNFGFLKKQVKVQVPSTQAPVKPKSENSSKENPKFIEDQVEFLLKYGIYLPLEFYSTQWYNYQGITFHYINQKYRIVNKRFYPYITFQDGHKLQFDGMLLATGLKQILKAIPNITQKSKDSNQLKLPQNVFAPLNSKQQYSRLMHFLNEHTIKKLIVLGLTTDSLEFVHSLHNAFPNIKVSILDEEPTTALTELYGPIVQKQILKEYTKRGIDIYIKITNPPLFENTFFKQKPKKKNAYLNFDFSVLNLPPQKHLVISQEQEFKYNDSITAQLTPQMSLNADGVVMFSNKFEGNVDNIKYGKYTDFFFSDTNQVETDHYLRTDSKRIFAAGGVAGLSFYATQSRLFTRHPTTIYEMGFNAGLNIQALKIPFYYVPVEFSKYFDKKLIYLGTRTFFNTIANLGSVEDWDFITLYSFGSKIVGACASPSKEQQIAVLRQAFRVGCVPPMEGILSGQVTFRDIEKVLKKLNKSYCFRDQIHQVQQNVNTKDLIWMERGPTAGFANDHPDMPEEELPNYEVDDKGIVKQV